MKRPFLTAKMPSSLVSASFSLWRKRLWHLRKGGWKQLHEFEQRRPFLVEQSDSLSFKHLFRRPTSPKFAPYSLPDPANWKLRRGLRVGLIADTFTQSALAYEWDQVALLPDTWRTQLSQAPIDLLFVESAWQGNNKAWRYQLTGPNAPSPVLQELVSFCQVNQIPTVFWNKEDPLHFDDFISTASLFDYVFTTDADVIPRYLDVLPHKNVGLMQFAVQPAIHNPIRTQLCDTRDLRDVCFAGTYFQEKYPERKKQLDLLLRASVDALPTLRTGLDIFARSATLSSKYDYPPEFRKYLHPELPFDEMLTANKSYKVLLNANSVTTSTTMCARRIFEVTACGTPVLGVVNPAVSAIFPDDEIIQVTCQEEATHWIQALCRSSELRDRMTHKAQRRIWKDHTFSHRIDDVLRHIGRAPSEPTASITAMVSTHRPHQIQHVLRQLAHQRDIECEPIILTHGFTASRTDRAFASDLGLEVQWIEGDSSLSLGDCYNTIINHASCPYIAKIDDDDFYGTHYLFDQVAALRYSNADVVGKAAHHVFFEEYNCLALRFADREHRFGTFVLGPTIVTRLSLAQDIRFASKSRGEDSQLLTDVISQGGRVYSSDRFGFVRSRSIHGEHTWQMDSAHMLASSNVISFGANFDSVLF